MPRMTSDGGKRRLRAQSCVPALNWPDWTDAVRYTVTTNDGGKRRLRAQSCVPALNWPDWTDAVRYTVTTKRPALGRPTTLRAERKEAGR